MKRNNRKKTARGGIGCLIGEKAEDATRLLHVEVVPLSRAFSFLANISGGVQHNKRHCKDGRRVRVVHPYPYTFATFAKSRWLGRPLIDVYYDEFGSYPKSYYEAAIKSGRILVSGKIVSCDYLIKQGDELTHMVHRHEPAVSSTSVTGEESEVEAPPVHIIYEDESILVVDKPASMPIHACGAYNYNSLIEVLHHWKPEAYGAGKLFPVHRLDRLTSGLVLIAKTSSLASSLGKCIIERDSCEKVYLARVKGRFPSILENANHPWRMKCTRSKTIEQDFGDEEIAETQFKRQKIAILPPISHGEVIGHDLSIDGGVCLQLQVNLQKQNNKNGCEAVQKQSCIAALGFWVTDCSGTNIENVTVQDFSKQCEDMSASEIIEYAIGSLTTDENERKQITAKRSIHWLHFACPCRISSHKNGICEAGDFSTKSESELEGIKPSQTAFTLLSYDKTTDTSLLLVKPDTGRMHQIRLHLQALDHPIANDHCYGGELWFGDDQGQQAFQKSRDWLNRLDKGSSKVSSGVELTPATEQEIYHVFTNKSREEDESIENFLLKTCVWCARCRGADAINSLNGSAESKRRNAEAVFQRTLMEYLVRSQGIWLHALQYSLNVNDEKGLRTVKYITELPSWAYDNK